MTERRFWSCVVRPLLRKAADGYPIHTERVENSVGDGTPDVDLVVNGVASKLELKWSPVYRSSPKAQVLGTRKGLRRSQVIWAFRRVRAGGRVFIVVGCPGVVWFLDARRMTVAQLQGVGQASRNELDQWCVWSNTTSTPEGLYAVLVG
jgi:hypothetical protein